MDRISDSEWVVMEVLWQYPNSLSSEIVRYLSDTDWQDKTIKTLLTRLVKKGVISYKQEGKSYRYYPVVERETCIDRERNNFINKLFKGSKMAFLASFIKQEKLSAEEIKALKTLLDKKDK